MSEQLPPKMKISMDLANQILAYMGRQPYEQVYQIIDRIQQAHKEHFMPQAGMMDAPQPQQTSVSDVEAK